MTREECIALLIRYAEYDGMGIPNLAGCKEAMRKAAELISQPQPSLPSNLDEAAEQYALDVKAKPFGNLVKEAFKAGAEWMAGQGWIDDGSMPPETKQESDTLQGHIEWTESEPVLAWDSLCMGVV